MGVMTTPAFAGASFDSNGSCLHHPDVRLTQKTTVDGGKVVYKELRRRCPKCTNMPSPSQQSSFHKSHSHDPEIRRHDSVQSSHTHGTTASAATHRREGRGRRRPTGDAGSHSAPNTPSSPHSNLRSSSRSRARSRSPGREARDRARSRSRPRSGSQPPNRQAVSRVPSGAGNGGGGGGGRKEYVTPFDSRGRCHYHSQVQLAKKKLTGGWKVLLDNCPRCIEDKYNAENNADSRSVGSGRSRRSSRSVRSSSGGRGQKITLPNNGKKSGSKYECPFDNQGYCHRHSHVRLAKKKLTGGWKILQGFCAECIKEDSSKHDDNKSVCSRGSRMSRRSMASRGSQRSARSKSRQRYDDDENDTDSVLSTSQSEQQSKKTVKRMSYVDDNGEEGLYTGYINSQCKPHGSGKIIYPNGRRFSGEWCEGSKVHGRTSEDKSSKGRKERRERRDRNGREFSSKGGGGGSRNPGGGGSVMATPPPPEKDTDPAERQREQQKQQKLREYKELYNTAQVVKNMLFVDFYGDRGRYTGEVNGDKMPHGTGCVRYDHGLMQEGMWTNGVLDEGSITSGPRSDDRRRRRARSKDP